MAGLISKNNSENYLQEINSFVQWCDEKFLHLNVSKTKEMLINFRRDYTVPDQVVIKNTKVERVQNYKYLGITIDNQLKWTENTDTVVKKVNSRLYCLKKLRSFEVSKKVLQMFYSSVIVSVLTFGASCWGGQLNGRDTDRIEKTIKKAGSTIGKKQSSFGEMYKKRLTDKLTDITSDSTHPLYDELDGLKNDSGRYRTPKVSTHDSNRYQKSFIPYAIRVANLKFHRS